MNNILDNTDVAPVEDSNTDYFNELVGEGKKYKDQNELAKAYFNADRTINIFKPRMDELRSENVKLSDDNRTRATLEALIQKLENLPQPTSSTTPANEETKPTIDMDEMDRRFEAKLQQFDTAKKEQSNATMVQSKLKERFGNNYSQIVREQIADLGLTPDEFETLSRKSPKTILKTLGVEDTQREGFQAPPRGNSSFGSKVEPKKTWSHFQRLKRENPNLYRDPKTTNEMIKAAEELGDAFYDSDYNNSDKDLLRSRF